MELTCTWCQGGMYYSMKTGKYRQVVSFYSDEYDINRTHIYRGGKKSGKLRNKNGEVVFNYQIDETTCKVEKVINGVDSGNWISIDMMMIMCD
jgi:hypothetical protein